MADANIDVVFRTPGLAKADRALGGLEKKAKKLENTEKKVGRTETKLAKDFIKNEDKKKKAIEKTSKARKKAATDAKKERQTRIQQIFQAIAKTGGATGAALGAAGEGVGVGGAIGVLGAVAGGAAVAMVALTNSTTRTVESLKRIQEFGNTFRDIVAGLAGERRGKALGFGQATGASILKLASRSSDKELERIIASIKDIGDPSSFSAIAQAQQSGLAKKVGINKLLQIMLQGKKLGQSPAEVIGALGGISDSQLAARKAGGSLGAKALGFGSKEELSRALAGVSGSGLAAVQQADRNRRLTRDLNNQTFGFFEKGLGGNQLLQDFNKLRDINATAATIQNNNMQKLIELQQISTNAQPLFLEALKDISLGLFASESEKSIDLISSSNVAQGER